MHVALHGLVPFDDNGCQGANTERTAQSVTTPVRSVAGTVSCTEAEEGRRVRGVIQPVWDLPPQKGCQRADVGEVRAEVDADEDR